jgi:hypothetical protein
MATATPILILHNKVSVAGTWFPGFRRGRLWL